MYFLVSYPDVPVQKIERKTEEETQRCETA